MEKIALGFSNTVDYEIEWDSAHLEDLVRSSGVHECDIEEKRMIRDMKDLIASILFHVREGSGCGMLTENPEVIEEFISGTKYRVALGGTNLRAAEVISDLGGSALVHLVSFNGDTAEKMPQGVSWVGGKEYQCCFPHVAIQFPKNAYVKANDIEITAPRENRVIYSGDIACAQMPLDKEFFLRASAARAVLLSSLDLIVNKDVLTKRLEEMKRELTAFRGERPLIFYEHACFADEKLGDIVRRELVPFIDIYSMNEDEFQALIGKKMNLLHAEEVQKGLCIAQEKLPDTTIIIHTCHWALACGNLADRINGALRHGMLTATTRYRQGRVDRESIEETGKLPVQKKAKEFSEKMERWRECRVRCLPAADIQVSSPTTVGLGDSFVGGFLYKYCFDTI